MENFFSYNGRLNRAPYFGYGLLVGLVSMVLQVIFAVIKLGALASLVSLAGLVVSSFITVKRFHDLNRPGWHYWLLLIPFYNLYLAIILLFKKGTAGPNTYGPDPLGSQSPAPAPVTNA